MNELKSAVGADAASFDVRGLRDAFARFTTGVTVVTTADGSKLEGVTVNSFASLSLEPPLVSWGLGNTALSLRSFVRAGQFAVNVLAVHQAHTAQHFATPQVDKFADIDFEAGAFGCPVLPGSLAVFECRTEQTVDAGDHKLFIGRVRRAAYREGDPLVFSAGRFCTPLCALA
jgi:flavin reductase (DIM6/NTAB) family NADH-FMN oxidoreductase RutF